MNNDDTWKIIENFVQDYGLLKHQIGSFNHFVDVGIPEIIESEADIIIDKKTSSCPVNPDREDHTRHTFKFEGVHIPNAGVIYNRKYTNIYPSEARLKDLTYESPVLVDIRHIIEGENENGKFINENVHKRVCIAHIPVMIMSSRCNLTKIPKSKRILNKECIWDNGGYFLVTGNERVLVSQIIRTYNIIIALKESNNDINGEIRSMSEETSHSILIKSHVGDRKVTFSLPYITQEIPVGIVFMAIGYTIEDIKHLINVEHPMMDTYLKYIDRDSYFVRAELPEKWDTNIHCVKCKNCSCNFREGDDIYAENIHDEDNKIIKYSVCAKEECKMSKWKKNCLKYIGQYTLHVVSSEEKKMDYSWQAIETELFPHLGISATNYEKAVFLGEILQKMFMTKFGMRSEDDRDNYINKRVESPGTLLYGLFKPLYKRFLATLKQNLQKKQSILLQISRAPSTITAGIKSCMATGKWAVPKQTYIRTGVCQILQRLSYISSISHLRRLSLPIGKEGKKAEIKLIHPSQYGYVCCVESPEGHQIGSVLNLTLLTSITTKINTNIVREIVEECEEVELIPDTKPEDLCLKTKIFLNGMIIGLTDEHESFIEKIRRYRRKGRLNYQVSIYYDDNDDKVYIFSDDGRLIRPLLVVEDGELRWNRLDLGDKKYDWKTLVDTHCVEYIDIGEAQYLNVATRIEEINDKFHYADINPAMIFEYVRASFRFQIIVKRLEMFIKVR